LTIPNNKNIRIDCYLAILDKTRKLYPNARFEVITRVAKHPLSPSWSLLNKAKAVKMPFDEYITRLSLELAYVVDKEGNLKHNEEVIAKLAELAEYSEKNLLFLVCYEKDPKFCHRSYIKKVLEIIQENHRRKGK